MEAGVPVFPPLLSGRQAVGEAPAVAAARGAAAGALGAGDLLWSLEDRALRLAIVLEPEVPRERCHEIVFTMMVAFADALGALAPPEVGVTYDWPNGLLANGGEVGEVGLTLAEAETDGVPDWMVLDLSVRLAPDGRDPEAGFVSHRTTLWDEGCAEIEPMDLLGATARHFLAWVHIWETEGFRPVHETWTTRMAERKALTRRYGGEEITGRPIGLDEHGGLLMRCGEETRLLETQAYFAGLAG